MSNLTMALVNNAALLLSLSIIYEIGYIFRIKNNSLSQLINGVLIGLIGIAAMAFSYVLTPGLVFDTRSVLISVAALTFGFIPGIVAAAVTVIYRLAMGGAGTLMGIMVIMSACILGLVWRRYIGTKKTKFRFLKIYLFGICVHIMMLVCTLLLPRETALLTLREIAVPVMVIYPVGVVLLSLLLLHQIEFRETQASVTEVEERFKTLVNNAPDAIFVLIDRKFIFVNTAGLRLLRASRPEDILGKTGLSIIHPDCLQDVQAYMDALHKNEIAPMPEERVYIRLDNTLVYVDVTVAHIRYGNRLGDLVFARDITERKQHQQKTQEIEAQLRQQQKLEAIGTLAGGVAHEINNPLNGVMNYAQLILDRTDKASASAEYAREIIHETERISTIVKNLLQFSRHEKQSHSYASIYDIVDKTVSLVKTIIKKDQITLDIALDDGLPDIKCRSQQIQQVIMNLLTNARDAVNEKYPGYNDNKIIRLRCSEYRSEGRRWLRLTVYDTGCGIPEELRDRIYEPFFSTKPKEIGTGLGLSISYGIVNEHHGKISFESEPGTHTTFMLDLPVDNGWSL